MRFVGFGEATALNLATSMRIMIFHGTTNIGGPVLF